MDGYGRVFERMYEGSMVGAGAAVFAVWCYCVTKADRDSHVVTLNVALLSNIIGESEATISAAISQLCKLDPDSKCKSDGGERLVRRDGLDYFMPSHEYYRTFGREKEVREGNAERQRRHRKKASDAPSGSESGPLSPSESNVPVANVPRDVTPKCDVWTGVCVSSSSLKEGCRGDCEDIGAVERPDTPRGISRFRLPRWHKQFDELWVAHCGGHMPRFSDRDLAEAVHKLGSAECLVRWRRYLDATERRYCSARAFVSKLAEWALPVAPSGPVDTRTRDEVYEDIRKKLAAAKADGK